MITFLDSTMITMDKDRVSTVVQSKEVKKFQDREELFDATIVSRIGDDAEDGATDMLSAKKITKMDDTFFLEDKVIYQRNGVMTLRTEELRYNSLMKTAKNRSDFIAEYNNNKLTGNTLYIDLEREYFKARDTHFEITMKEKN